MMVCLKDQQREEKRALLTVHEKGDEKAYLKAQLKGQ